MTLLRTVSSMMIDWPHILRGKHKQGQRLRSLSKSTRMDLGMMLDLVTLLSTDYHSMMSWGEAWLEFENRAYAHLKLPEPEDKEEVYSRYVTRTKMIEQFKKLPFWDSIRTPHGITDDTVQAVEYLMITARKMDPIVQSFSCMSCDLQNYCKLWTDKLSHVMQGKSQFDQDPLKGVTDKEMEKLRHAECPWRELSPENQEKLMQKFLEFMNALFDQEDILKSLDPQVASALENIMSNMASAQAMAKAAAKMEQDQDEDKDDGGGGTSVRGGIGTARTKNPSSTMTSTFMNSIELLGKRLVDLGALFQVYVGKVTDEIIEDQFGQPEDRKVLHVTDSPDPGRYRDERDMARVKSSDLAAPDDVFYAKLAGNDLDVTHHLEEHVKEDLYVLLDSSGSMSVGIEGGWKWMCEHRGVAASAVVAGICRRAMIRSNRVLFRNFDSCVSPLMIADTNEKLKILRQKVLAFDYNGGGTNLDLALQVMAKDFRENGVDAKETEVLIVSDLMAYLTETAEKALQVFKDEGVILRILQMEEDSGGEMLEQLKKHAHVFVRFDSSQSAPDLLFDVLKRVDKEEIRSQDHRN